MRSKARSEVHVIVREEQRRGVGVVAIDEILPNSARYEAWVSQFGLEARDEGRIGTERLEVSRASCNQRPVDVLGVEQSRGLGKEGVCSDIGRSLCSVRQVKRYFQRPFGLNFLAYRVSAAPQVMFVSTGFVASQALDSCLLCQ